MFIEPEKLQLREEELLPPEVGVHVPEDLLSRHVGLSGPFQILEPPERKPASELHPLLQREGRVPSANPTESSPTVRDINTKNYTSSKPLGDKRAGSRRTCDHRR